MKTKKAQSELITTVLIILLVLAAVVIVWQVVQSTVKKGGTAVTTQSECLGLNMDVTAVDLVAAPATPTVNDVLQVKVTRKASGPVGKVTLKLIVDGAIIVDADVAGTKSLGELESTTLTYANWAKTTKPAKTEVAAITEGGTTCNSVACLGADC